MQVKFNLKVVLKSWDVEIYENVKQTISKVWYSFCVKHLKFLVYFEKSHMYYKEKKIQSLQHGVENPTHFQGSTRQVDLAFDLKQVEFGPQIRV